MDTPPNPSASPPAPTLPIPEPTPTYYGVPPIKKPHWKWEIVLYFFLGGLAAGSYVLATVAEWFGDRRHRDLVRAGRYLALPALLICPVLLIKDLGKPSRFYNMLRVVKLKSPMSLGTWALLAFSGCAGLSAVGELAAQGVARGTWPGQVALLIPRKALGGVGTIFALFVGGYTGVLLTSTAVPLWAKNKYLLGPTFLSGAFTTGASALGLALAATGRDDDEALHALEDSELLALAVELGLLAAVSSGGGRATHPLVRGTYATLFWPAVGGGVGLPLLAALVGRARGHRSRPERVLTAILTLLGGLALRWCFVFAGKESADDPQAYWELTH